MGPGMHRHVEVLIGRLATDPRLQRRFAEQPFEAIRAERLELTEIELAALAATDPEALRAFTESLDARLKKAAPTTEMRPASGATPIQEMKP
jgi:hypothetical protein